MDLLAAWKVYRGSDEGYSLTASEAWGFIKDYMDSPYRQVESPHEAIVFLVHEAHYCKVYDC